MHVYVISTANLKQFNTLHSIKTAMDVFGELSTGIGMTCIKADYACKLYTVGIKKNDPTGRKALPTCRIPSNSGKTAEVRKASSEVRKATSDRSVGFFRHVRNHQKLRNSDVKYTSTVRTYVYSSSASYVRTVRMYVE